MNVLIGVSMVFLTLLVKNTTSKPYDPYLNTGGSYSSRSNYNEGGYDQYSTSVTRTVDGYQPGLYSSSYQPGYGSSQYQQPLGGYNSGIYGSGSSLGLGYSSGSGLGGYSTGGGLGGYSSSGGLGGYSSSSYPGYSGYNGYRRGSTKLDFDTNDYRNGNQALIGPTGGLGYNTGAGRNIYPVYQSYYRDGKYNY